MCRIVGALNIAKYFIGVDTRISDRIQKVISSLIKRNLHNYLSVPVKPTFNLINSVYATLGEVTKHVKV